MWKVADPGLVSLSTFASLGCLPDRPALIWPHPVQEEADRVWRLCAKTSCRSSFQFGLENQVVRAHCGMKHQGVDDWLVDIILASAMVQQPTPTQHQSHNLTL